MSDTTPMPSLGDVVTGFIRTIVPMIVGWLVALAASFEITLDDGTVASLNGLLTVLFGALYYLIVRFAERRWPGIGWLLGSPKQPTYVNSKTIKGSTVDEVDAAAMSPGRDYRPEDDIIGEVLDGERG